MRQHLMAVCAAACLCAPASAHTLSNGRVTLTQADSSQGYNTTDQDRVDAISWINSQGASTGNLAANGGPVHCGDPQEFFGQSYDEGDGAGLYLVIAGTVSRWLGSSTMAGSSYTNGKPNCENTPMSGSVHSIYTLFSNAALINLVKVQRVFTFNAHALSEPYNMRGYVPRLPISSYNTVLAPDASGTVQSYTATSCSTACPIPSWNGTWFAEDSGQGSGMVVLRDYRSANPATVDLDNDSYSQSDNTSIVLTMPSGGWTGKVTEIEYLCFYDTKTWSAARRAAGRLPEGCAVKIK